MGKYFGTDGFRGRANEDLKPWQALKIGECIGAKYAAMVNGRAKVVIGRDTRRSGEMLESALAAGLAAGGADAVLLGVVPTPAVAFAAARGDIAAGCMVSASHNPFYDNGIKCIGPDGRKIDGATEAELEDAIDGKIVPQSAEGRLIGRVYKDEGIVEAYLEHLKSASPARLDGFKIALDTANGSASAFAEKLFKELGAETVCMADRPDGDNINEGCGSTHIEKLTELVVNEGCDMGFAFDGDADRCLAADAEGNVINGDHILYICGKFLKKRGLLNKDTVVGTVMANLGLSIALEKEGISLMTVGVGDKYVAEAMNKDSLDLGGEQSGHIIFGRTATTGDGMLTALMLAGACAAERKSLKELASGLTVYPQELVNVRVKSRSAAMQDKKVLQAVSEAEKQLEGRGRVLVRASGTEKLVRVMAEAPDMESCRAAVGRVVDVLRACGHEAG